ncbi:MAG: bifunctional [glutamate--ammonia ligase]-adenylyl-L-tyrosine phosphorylase/[glutamate--ammonia-ligase] adenylyltransferase [Deltaproteobacteria bacterium]|nr:bifunctional [glutamate--ammonia ligase]-adenylyl-L-tyrosine phosphorylase/[glutamate--ammonia-ligase] adenylyltransferase [Deltaproteobacteria bacterium]
MDPAAAAVLLQLADPAASPELLTKLDDPLRTVAVALRRGPDPAGGLTRLRTLLGSAAGLEAWLAEVFGDPRVVALLGTILSQSPYLAQTIARDPHLCQELAADPFLQREKDGATMRAEVERTLAGTTRPEDVARVLRAYRNREYLRLGARELGWGTFAEVGRELAALAAACLDAAVAAARAELERRYGPAVEEGGARARFVVIGMGKLGGEELNFSSDIDLQYVYSSDAGRAGDLTLHEFFVRLAERTARLIGDRTDDGFVFRVDLRLRPEGTRGPLANSLAGLEAYYESWGRPWERQAWLKARPVAGDLDLGLEVLAALEPFVFPRSTSPGVIEEIHELNRRIKAELKEPQASNIKLGPGGIREVEFFVQALQLLHAGKNPTLRARGTLRALDVLLFAGLVSERERRTLADAYVFLRRLEHRLQLEHGVATHSLPADEAALARIARRLGYETLPDFRADLERHTAAVAEAYRTLGLPEDATPPAVAALLDPSRGGPEQRASLERLGFRDPDAAAQELELLRRKPDSPFAPEAAAPAARFAPALLEEVTLSPDPDLALKHLTDFVGRRGAWSGVWRLLEEHRPLMRLLVSLFGMSDFLAKLFLAHPELLDQLLALGHATPRRTRDEVRADLAARLARPPARGGPSGRAVGPVSPGPPWGARGDAEVGPPGSEQPAPGVPPGGPPEYEDALNRLRRFRNEEILRIGLFDSAGALDVIEVQQQLTNLADAILEATVPLVLGQAAARYGRLDFRGADGGPAEGPRLAVVGLGKLGGGELTYASDLDVIFVYAGDAADVIPAGMTRQELFSRVSTRLIGALGSYLEEGRLYEVDTRLRPSGQHGTLVSSLAAFEDYHRRQAMLWERQALIRARFVAGDAALGSRIEARCREHVYGGAGPSPSASEMAREIGRLRDRMEKELAREKPGQYNIKSGRGGLVDVEFIVQFLQLQHGGAHPELRVPGTRAALQALRQVGVLDEATTATLEEAYLFLRKLENRLRIVQDRSISELRAEPGEVDKLARRMGYNEPQSGGGRRLLDDYLMHTSRVRDLYRTFFRGSDA